jgi:DNA-binding PadR family transcriptional regulator
MAIERDQRDRMELELAGYRSARILGERASWLFHGGNLERGLAQKLLHQVDNGTEKASYYYKLTPRGIRELKAAGPGFTYGDAEGRRGISFNANGKWQYRLIKVSAEERKARAAQLLGAFARLVTSDNAHERLELERQGWLPQTSVWPDSKLIDRGLVERTELNRGERYITYFRLTDKGKALIMADSVKSMRKEQATARRQLKTETRSRLREITREAAKASKRAKTQGEQAFKELLRRQARSRDNLDASVSIAMWSRLLDREV